MPLLARLLAAALLGAAAAGVLDAASEEEVLSVLGGSGGEAAALSASAADVAAFVRRGWHEAVRAVVRVGHLAGDEDSGHIATQVRQAVQAEKNRLDDLLRALDKNYHKAVDVSPAAQWAQNSTHVFLAVKFAQRWNAPGALEVENETVSITSCCFNFEADGEHSFIRRKYRLSLELYEPLLEQASAWSLASVGRMTVTMAKAKAATWPRLLAAPAGAPKNLGIWRDMKEKWSAELDRFAEGAKAGGGGARPTDGAQKGKRRGKRKDSDDEDDEDDDALDKEVELLSECPRSTFAGTPVAELCAAAWGDVVEKPRVRGRRWLVEFYSSQGGGDLGAMRSLMPVWKRLADVFPSMVPGGRVGAVDCSREKDLCKRLGATEAKLPQVRRLAGGSRSGKAWSGGLDASLEEFAAFGGADGDEL